MNKKVEPKFKSGDRVTWSSQAAGYTKTKMGTVRAVLESMENVSGVFDRLHITPSSYRLHAARQGHAVRYLIELDPVLRAKVRHFYAPLVSVVDKSVQPDTASVV